MFSENKAAPVDDLIPPPEGIKEAMQATVWDIKGESHTLSSLVGGPETRTIIILVRHNHCGLCMEYVRDCSKNEKLLSTSKGGEGSRTKVIVIGHGSHEGFQRYNELSESAFPMYSDQEKKIYTALGMSRRFLGKSKDTEKRPSYLKQDQSEVSVALSSAWKMVTSGSLFWKGGDIALLGGEFVFDGDSNCIFSHRMRDTTDHTAVPKLAEYVI